MTVPTIVRPNWKIDLELAELLAAPRIEAALPKGSARPWISKSKDGVLVLKP